MSGRQTSGNDWLLPLRARYSTRTVGYRLAALVGGALCHERINTGKLTERPLSTKEVVRHCVSGRLVPV